jgi:Flp pilus assembly protein TadG
MRIARKDGQKGMSAVEFALVMPIVFLIMFGIFEFGMALWRKQELTAAVREGARKGVVATNPRKSKSYIETAVKTYLDGIGMKDGARTATCSGTCPCAASGDTLTVVATYPTGMGVVSRLSELFYGSGPAATKTLSASVSMQCE